MAELREYFALFDRKTLLDELLAKSPQPGPELPSEPLLVGEVGLPFRPKPPADPIERWIVLMEVVEALCLRCPERPPPTKGAVFQL